MITFGNKVVKFNSKWLYPKYLRRVILNQTTGGVISAQPMSGYDGDEVTLSNTPTPPFEFDSYSVTGAVLDGNKFTFAGSDVQVQATWIDPYNPLNLPPNTMRVRTSDGNPPIKQANNGASYETATLVEGTTDIYDVYKNNVTYQGGNSFKELLHNSTNVIEILGANTTGVTNMNLLCNGCSNLRSTVLFDTSSVTDFRWMYAYCSSQYFKSVPLYDTSSASTVAEMFDHCTYLETVPLFDLSNVRLTYSMFDGCTHLASVPQFIMSNVIQAQNMFYGCTSLTSIPQFDLSNLERAESMFNGCTSLTSIPLFSTSKLDKIPSMFYGCTNVESGALALYQQISSQSTPPSDYMHAFYNCGSNTVTGAAELAQIPASWK